MNWNQREYTVIEGDTVGVCAEQLGATERGFSVEIRVPVSQGKPNL